MNNGVGGGMPERRPRPETGHPQTDFFNGDGGNGDRRRQIPAVHHGDTVADRKEFIDFFAHDQKAGPLGAQL